MSEKLQNLLKEVQDLEHAVEVELRLAQETADYTFRKGKVVFKKDILRLHRRCKQNVLKYIANSNLLFLLTSPVIYAMVVPAFVLDVFCRVYQTICFPVYGISKVDRRDYIRMDRHRLAYLNGVEKVNCDFCAYFNGCVAFAREVAARTEQYWCPIRHASAIKGVHARYGKFSSFGDAESYHKQLEALRAELMKG